MSLFIIWKVISTTIKISEDFFFFFYINVTYWKFVGHLDTHTHTLKTNSAITLKANTHSHSKRKAYRDKIWCLCVLYINWIGDIFIYKCVYFFKIHTHSPNTSLYVKHRHTHDINCWANGSYEIRKLSNDEWMTAQQHICNTILTLRHLCLNGCVCV